MVEAPGVGAELPVEAVADLKQIHGIEGGVQALVALVVGAGVQHAVADELVVVAVQQLADEMCIRDRNRRARNATGWRRPAPRGAAACRTR